MISVAFWPVFCSWPNCCAVHTTARYCIKRACTHTCAIIHTHKHASTLYLHIHYIRIDFHACQTMHSLMRTLERRVAKRHILKLAFLALFVIFSLTLYTQHTKLGYVITRQSAEASQPHTQAVIQTTESASTKQRRAEKGKIYTPSRYMHKFAQTPAFAVPCA